MMSSSGGGEDSAGTDTADESSPAGWLPVKNLFLGTLQGIGCFDGHYIDWVLENNLVITDLWQGISLF